MLQLPTASDRDYESVRNWVQGNKPLVRSESSLFLQPVKDGDIVALRDVPRSTGIISKLLEKVVPSIPRVANDKVCFLFASEESNEIFIPLKVTRVNRLIKLVLFHRGKYEQSL